MAKNKEPTNPFYVLLVIVGAVFAITACAYGVMAFRAVAAQHAAEASPSGEGLMQFLDKHGMALLAGELVVLALATFGAIGTDGYWSKRKAANEIAPTERESP